MMVVYRAAWISVVDESMSIWFTRWTCPGWMFVPRKPHPFGNEYHVNNCGIWGVMYFIELVEGKDRPVQLPAPRFDEFGKTVGLVLRMCQPLFATGKCVIMDSGFCVLDALIKLRQRGVFASIMIKKRKYWPRGINGDAIKEHMADKAVGAVDALPGQKDNQHFNVFCMKDPSYVTMLMATFGNLEPVGDEKAKASRSWKDENGAETRAIFQYHEPFHQYYQYRGVCDMHNARRHSPISLEETWATKTWEHRVFAFILAICEINTYLVAIHKYAFAPDLVVLTLRKQLAQALIQNTFDRGAAAAASRRENDDYMAKCEHEVVTAPQFALKYDGNSWIFSQRQRYPQHKCKHPECQKYIRTYCGCTPGYWRCSMHIGQHISDLQ